MKKPRIWMVFLLAGALLLAAAGGRGNAHAPGYSLAWGAVSSGGGAVAGGRYTLSGVVGQPAAGQITGGNYRLTTGLGGRTASPPEPERLYMPIVLTGW